jgi:hypothetical protein
METWQQWQPVGAGWAESPLSAPASGDTAGVASVQQHAEHNSDGREETLADVFRREVVLLPNDTVLQHDPVARTAPCRSDKSALDSH